MSHWNVKVIGQPKCPEYVCRTDLQRDAIAATLAKYGVSCIARPIKGGAGAQPQARRANVFLIS